jgi:hypothetical protein
MERNRDWKYDKNLYNELVRKSNRYKTESKEKGGKASERNREVNVKKKKDNIYLITYLLTEQSTSWEAANCPAT